MSASLKEIPMVFKPLNFEKSLLGTWECFSPKGKATFSLIDKDIPVFEALGLPSRVWYKVRVLTAVKRTAPNKSIVDSYFRTGLKSTLNFCRKKDFSVVLRIDSSLTPTPINNLISFYSKFGFTTTEFNSTILDSDIIVMTFNL